MVGRKSIGEAAMSSAERQRRRRERLKASEPPPGSALALAVEVRNFVHRRHLEAYSKLASADVYAALNLVSREIEYEHRRNTEPLHRAIAGLDHARIEHRKARTP